MRIVKRVFTIVVTLVIVIVLGLGGAGTYMIRKDFPQTSGTLSAPGLRAQVTVYRDQYGVPQIYAENEHDLFFAQGYVHAQERFWQMEFWRRIGAGRTAELLGAGALPVDLLMRTLGVKRVSDEEVAQLTPDERTVLEDYAAGVNAYVNAHREQLGLEFTVLGLNGVKWTVEPWEPVNTLTWTKLLAYDLGGNYSDELLRVKLISALGPERAAMLMPPFPGDRPVILPPATRFPGLAFDGVLEADAAYRALKGVEGEGLGSNNWVVAGSHTTTGQPLLANDPHLGIQMPSIWFEVGLHCVTISPTCSFEAAGFSFAGAPGVVLGHNARIAWGFTNTGPDVQDLYLETLKGDQVQTAAGLVPLEITEEVIVVQGKLPTDAYVPANAIAEYDEALKQTRISLRVRSVPQHGPLLSDVSRDVAAAVPPPIQVGPLISDANSNGAVAMGDEHGLSLRWTALEPAHMIAGFMGLARASSWETFRDALRNWSAPSQNIVYADVDGHIGWQVPGWMPIRPAGCDGLTPAPGDGTCEWQGYVPFDELPSSYDPPQGWIATANQAPVGPDYPYALGQDWDYGDRAARINELLQAKDKLSLDDLAAIQFDDKDLSAMALVPQLAGLTLTRADSTAARDTLLAWDFQARRDSPAALIYASFLLHLQSEALGDELGGTLDAYLGSGSRQRYVLRLLAADAGSPWWDDTRTHAVQETREAIFARALDATVDELTTRLGADQTKWVWGGVHTATFANQSLGRSNALGGLIKALFNRGPFAVDGGSSIVNATSWYAAAETRYTVRSVPSMRALYDLSNFEQSRLVHTTGQSGHPYHPHYDDFIQLWANGQYHAHVWTRAAVEASAVDVLMLVP